MSFALVILCGILARELLKWHFKYWEREHVPGPKPSLLVGNLGPLLTMKKHLATVCDEWYNAYKDQPFIGYFKVFKPAVFVRDPDIIKDILVKDQSSFSANDFKVNTKLDPLLAHNPFVVDGERWKKSRQLLTPIFTSSKMKTLFPMMERVGKQFVDFIERQGGQNLEAKSISAAFTTQNVAACAFSLDAECFENPKCEWRIMGKKIFQPSIINGITFTITLFVPLVAKIIPMRLVPKEVDAWMRKMVSGLLQERRTKNVVREDQLQSLLNLKKADLTEEIIAGHALAFFTEGFETSSTTLAFLIFNLAENPEVQERLFEEIKQGLADNGNVLSYDVIQKFEYMDWCLQESLRMNPPVAAMQKLATKRYLLKREVNGKMTGTVIPEGTTVLIPLMAIQNDPKYYPEPEKFRPERFSQEEKNERPASVYFPFGDGPRMCMGMRFAQAQIKVALSLLIQNFRIRVSPKHKSPWQLDNRTFLIQARDGLMVSVERR
ncbi:probable cytochrome P450 6a13 isoform X2 [Uranotaenia lowii]|uniref:probable cytochrome P450 6a13 isoform X2 n=1 Tax=Uranotaenia lowii TaxID=190385 RepID=UPI00247ACD13|nr:probable cytochrome P450 6a13 isoform X2 [Uranotaenia lowii]